MVPSEIAATPLSDRQCSPPSGILTISSDSRYGFSSMQRAWAFCPKALTRLALGQAFALRRCLTALRRFTPRRVRLPTAGVGRAWATSRSAEPAMPLAFRTNGPFRWCSRSDTLLQLKKRFFCSISGSRRGAALRTSGHRLLFRSRCGFPDGTNLFARAGALRNRLRSLLRAEAQSRREICYDRRTSALRGAAGRVRRWYRRQWPTNRRCTDAPIPRTRGISQRRAAGVRRRETLDRK